jgi:drug/metabolite transporter (DMT)-like permease
VISYVAAFLAAVANATSNALNRKAAREEPQRVQFRLRLIMDLLQHRAWLAAVGLMFISFVFSAVALGTGQLASVQLIIILELPMTLILGAWIMRIRLSPQEWVGVAAMTAGVIGLLAVLDPQPGPSRAGLTGWIVGSAVSVGAILILVLVARAQQGPVIQAALLGIASGLGYGLTAAYTKGFADQFAAGGLAAVFSSWQLCACAVTGILSTWLLENAYQTGPLTAAQPGITLMDPLVATTWGVVVFGEQIRSGWALGLAAVAVAAVAAGAYFLVRSPRLQALQKSGRGQASEGQVGDPAGRRGATPRHRTAD